MKILLEIIFLFLFLNGIEGQFKLDTKLGLENPYFYEYNLNYSPSSSAGFEVQDFKFFRTKFYSIGLSYESKILKSDRFVYQIGMFAGLMDQFIADTIIDPTMQRLVSNVRHRSYYLEPNLSVGFYFTKSIFITGGLNGFIPLIKVLNTNEETIKFEQKFEPDFYPNEVYAKFGLYKIISRFTLGIEIHDTGGTRSKLWVRQPSFLYGNAGPSHNAQRWMFSVGYKI